MVAHSAGSRAPSRCMRQIPGCSRRSQSSCRSTAVMRGPAARESRSSGGDGRTASQCRGARLSGSCARSAWRSVVPLRGRPVRNRGLRISWPAISGRRARSSTRLSRFMSSRIVRCRAVTRPMSFRCASVSYEEMRRPRAWWKVSSSAKSSRRVRRRASANRARSSRSSTRGHSSLAIPPAPL